MIRCHFCRLSDTQVELVVVREMGGRIDNAICNYCIEEANRLLQERRASKSQSLIERAAEKGGA